MIVRIRAREDRIKKKAKYEPPMPIFLNEFLPTSLPSNARFLIEPDAFCGWAHGRTNKEIGSAIESIARSVQAQAWAELEEFRFILSVNTGSVGRETIPAHVKRDVLAVGLCAYCGSSDNLSIDHVKPVSKGGGNERTNLQCLCLPCNIKKGNRC